MTDRPIIFSAPMVLAMLAGRKHQTRRILKPQPYVVQEQNGVRWWNLAGAPGGTIVMGDAELLRAHHKPAIGDRLWVKETTTRSGALMQYCADHTTTRLMWPDDWKRAPQSAWFMPRSFSRITLTVTDVRVQRLREISEEDAQAEGLVWAAPHWGIPGVAQSWDPNPRLAFSVLWDSLHDDPNGWDGNPFVIALSFSVEHRNIDAQKVDA